LEDLVIDGKIIFKLDVKDDRTAQKIMQWRTHGNKAVKLRAA
jgi:hypothetical protein